MYQIEGQIAKGRIKKVDAPLCWHRQIFFVTVLFSILLGAAARTACRHGIPTTHTQQVDRQGGNMLLQQNATTLVLSWQ